MTIHTKLHNVISTVAILFAILLSSSAYCAEPQSAHGCNEENTKAWEGKDTQEAVERLNTLGLGCFEGGEYTLAERALSKAMLLEQKIHGPRTIVGATIMNSLSAVLYKIGDLNDAEVLVRESLTTFEQKEGPESRGAVIALQSLASLSKARGDLEAAEKLEIRALSGFRRLFGNEMRLIQLRARVSACCDHPGSNGPGSEKPWIDSALA